MGSWNSHSSEGDSRRIHSDARSSNILRASEQQAGLNAYALKLWRRLALHFACACNASSELAAQKPS